MKNFLFVFALILMSGCMPDGNPATESAELFSAVCADTAGFWLGLWQGMIAPLSWLVSLFVPEVNVYEVCNSGGWYDFGFIIAIGGLAASSK